MGISGAEGERSGNIHFAGEHTSTDFQGYLNGAVDTGISAAKEILTDLRATLDREADAALALPYPPAEEAAEGVYARG